MFKGVCPSVVPQRSPAQPSSPNAAGHAGAPVHLPAARSGSTLPRRPTAVPGQPQPPFPPPASLPFPGLQFTPTQGLFAWRNTRCLGSPGPCPTGRSHHTDNRPAFTNPLAHLRYRSRIGRTRGSGRGSSAAGRAGTPGGKQSWEGGRVQDGPPPGASATATFLAPAGMITYITKAHGTAPRRHPLHALTLMSMWCRFNQGHGESIMQHAVTFCDPTPTFPMWYRLMLPMECTATKRAKGTVRS